jgi:glucose-1-phosphate cytidylyltransferase
MSDVTFNMRDNTMKVHDQRAEDWNITLVDTGDESMTGGRLRRVADYVKDEEAFCFTYGDGVSDLDISATLAFHKAHGKAATLTATFPPGRFGALDIQKGQVLNLKEMAR